MESNLYYVDIVFSEKDSCPACMLSITWLQMKMNACTCISCLKAYIYMYMYGHLLPISIVFTIKHYFYLTSASIIM